MEYMGYKYIQEIENDGDVRKRFHYIVTPDGEKVSVNWGPYYEPAYAIFVAEVDAVRGKIMFDEIEKTIGGRRGKS